MAVDIFAKFNALAQEATGKTTEERLKEAEEAEIRGHKVHINAVKQSVSENQEVQVQLPMWGERIRGVPNSVLRSALFTATRRGKRAYYEGVKIASVDGINVLFSGPRLDQADLDVWEQCLHLAKTGGLGNRISFSAHGFLKAINRDTGKANHEWLKGAFRRLATSAVELADGKRAYFGALISYGQRDDETGRYGLELNPKIANLYNGDGWTGVDWEQRRQLKGKPLALWLHGFYSSHTKPFDYKVETIHGLCGSETGEMKAFKQNLQEALKDLATATGWFCRIENSKVQIFKDQSHLLARLT
jgi:hypothetical protein